MLEYRSDARDEVEESDLREYEDMLRMARLSPEERELCDLYYCEKLKLYQIAMKWHCSESRVYKMHTRILDRVSRAITRRSK